MTGNTGKEAKKKYRSISEASLTDVVRAIRTIKAFTDFRAKMQELFTAFAAAGVDVSRLNFNDPMSMIRAFGQLQKANTNIDVDTILDELERCEEVTLREVEEAVRILNQYATLSRKVDYTVGSISRQRKTQLGDLEAVAKMFGFKLPATTKKEETEEEEVEEEEPELTEEDIKEIKRIVREYKREKG
ncbi:MAG: hypothetical protein DRJ98_08925 [Thermoprotei archaeon]|nr:MAG: hypothetical protein DRJ98_08925 [Thermoprotei archaeon]